MAQPMLNQELDELLTKTPESQKKARQRQDSKNFIPKKPGLSMAFCEAPGEWSIPDNVRTIAITLITAAAGTVGVGRFAEAFDKRDK